LPSRKSPTMITGPGTDLLIQIDAPFSSRLSRYIGGSWLKSGYCFNRWTYAGLLAFQLSVLSIFDPQFPRSNSPVS
jgi:hypothetical protein